MKANDQFINHRIAAATLALVLGMGSICAAQNSPGQSKRWERPGDYEIGMKSGKLIPLKRGAMNLRNPKHKLDPADSLKKGERAMPQLQLMQQFVQTQALERVHVLIQLQEIPSGKQKKDLEDAGIHLLRYLPDRAWIASVEQSSAETLVSNELIRWSDEFRGADKVAPALTAMGIASWGVSPSGDATFSIRAHADISMDELRERLEEAGLRILSSDDHLRCLRVEGPTTAVEILSADDAVEWIDNVPPPPTTHNDVMRQSIGVNSLQAIPHNLSGEGVIVGIWDGGSVDRNHDDFDVRVSVVDTGEGVSDHATHVAGIVGGSGRLSESHGGTPFQWRGVALSAGLVSYDYDNDPWLEHNPALNSHNVDLSQNSWGWKIGWSWDEEVASYVMDEDNRYLFGSYTEDALNYDEIIRGVYGPKIPICFSAGNDRSDANPNDPSDRDPQHPVAGYDCISPPATAKNVISVGATESDTDAMTSFSAWGPTDDGRIKPEIVAPGSHSGNDPEHGVGLKSTIPGGSYDVFQGTSMSAPVVSGAIALLMQRSRDLYAGLQLLPSTYKALLTHTAVDLGNTGPDYAFGFGRINVVAADELVRTRGFLEASISGNGEVDEYPILVGADVSELKVTLVWDDPPAASGAPSALVNDLDLVLIDPSSGIHLPWSLDPDNPQMPAGTGNDAINIIEQVLVSSPAAGDWVIRVTGNMVPQAPQSYSLVSEHIAGEINSQILVVNNDGKQTLSISDITHSEPWLHFGATTLSVPPGKSQGILVTVDASGLAPGEYADTIQIASNDPDSPYAVPVSLSVSPVNLPPTVPHSPLPLNGVTGQPLTPTLSWRAEDSDSNDPLTYDVYFGEASGSLSQLSEAQSEPYVIHSGLAFDTFYYWQVVARDSHGLGTDGPEWQFRTFTAEGDAEGDGLSNGDEVAYGTDPYRLDTDQDGYSDKEEISVGSNPLDPASTPQNLITVFYDDFSDGNADDWSQNSDNTSSWTVENGLSHSDQYSLCLTGGDVGGGSFYGEVASGLISVNSSSGYRVSAFVRGPGRIAIYEFDEQGLPVGQFQSIVVDNSEFDLLAQTIETDAVTKFIRVGLVSLSVASTCFDDVKVERASGVLLYMN